MDNKLTMLKYIEYCTDKREEAYKECAKYNGFTSQTSETMRKGAIVKYCGSRKDFIETWGELFEVYHKEGNFLKLISLKKPYFDVCASVPCKDCKLVEE